MRIARVAWSLLTWTALRLARARARRLRPLDFGPFRSALAALSVERDGAIEALVNDASIARLQELMGTAQLTSEELTLHLLGGIRRLDGEAHSLIELNPVALSEARAADARRASGGVLGPLDGVPVTIKDNIETAAPMRTTAGSMALADHVAAGDAPVVRALRDAGAVILGKANLSELAGAVARTAGVSAVGGQTLNPYGTRFSPGGSSSGSAVTVALGLCVASVGTETSGSLIAPAACNGVVGMMPSHGVVSTEGIVPLVRHQDSAGPIARCVADAAVLLAAMATRDLAVSLSPDALSGVTVGVLREDILGQRTPLEDTADNAAILQRMTDGLVRAGATVVDASVADAAAVAAFDAGFTKVVLGGLTHDTMGYLAAAGAPVCTLAGLHAFNLRDPRKRMPMGQLYADLALFFAIPRDAYEAAALEYRATAARILAATFEATGARVLLSISNRHSALYATAGHPAITVPVGLRANGMPAGATLIGRAGADAELLAAAYAFESATRLRVAPPRPAV